MTIYSLLAKYLEWLINESKNFVLLLVKYCYISVPHITQGNLKSCEFHHHHHLLW